MLSTISTKKLIVTCITNCVVDEQIMENQILVGVLKCVKGLFYVICCLVKKKNIKYSTHEK